MNDNKTDFNKDFEELLKTEPRCNRPQVIRWILSATHYRKPINITAALFLQALQNLDKIYTALKSFPKDEWRPGTIVGHLMKPEDNSILCENALKGPLDQNVISALCDDLNTPLAYSKLHALVKEINKATDETTKYNLQLKLLRTCQFLGFLLETPDEWFAPYFCRYSKEDWDRLKQQQLNMIEELRDKVTNPNQISPASILF